MLLPHCPLFLYSGIRIFRSYNISLLVQFICVLVTSIKYNLGRILAEFGKLEVSDLVQLTTPFLLWL